MGVFFFLFVSINILFLSFSSTYIVYYISKGYLANGINGLYGYITNYTVSLSCPGIFS